MSDSSWSSTKVLAWVTWGLAGLFTLACVVVDGLAGATTTGGMALCTVAILLGAGAATMHTRSFLCCQQARIKMAYEMGLKEARLEAYENGAIRLRSH